MSSGRGATALGLLTIVIGTSAFAWLRVDQPVRSRIVDADTNSPIPGATVRFERTTDCPTYVHGSTTHKLPPQETTTGPDGRFAFDRRVSITPCFFSWRYDSLYILAPGYLPASAHDTDVYITTGAPIRSEQFALTPIRYAIELAAYPSFTRQKDDELRGSRYLAALEEHDRLAFARVGRPGVFTSAQGAVFDRVAVVGSGIDGGVRRIGVLAQDRLTGALHSWTVRGDARSAPVRPPAGLSLIAGLGHGDFPLFVRDGRIFFSNDSLASIHNLGTPHWFDFPSQFGNVRFGVDSGARFITVEANGHELAAYDLERWIEWLVPRRKPGEPREIVPQPRLLRDVLPPGGWLIECATYRSTPQQELTLFARADGERAIFVAHPDTGPSRWKAERVEIPRPGLQNEVVACAVGWKSLYIAQRQEGIRRLEIRQQSLAPLRYKRVATVSPPLNVDGPGGRLDFVSIAVGPVRADVYGPPYPEAVYAAAQDDAIYRFSEDLLPDGRLERAAKP